jgi:hypothetical protein
MLLLSTLLAGTGADWKLEKTADGITVWSRKGEGPVRELRSEVVINGTAGAALAVLVDWNSYPEWVYRCDTSSTILQLQNLDVFHYQGIEAPWPVSSRDFVVHVTVRQSDEGVIVLRSVAIPDQVPARSDRVRIKVLRASWTIAPVADDQVRLTYQMLVDPGGNVPAWLVNAAAVDGPFDTMESLRDRMKLSKYSKAAVPLLPRV